MLMLLWVRHFAKLDGALGGCLSVHRGTRQVDLFPPILFDYLVECLHWMNFLEVNVDGAMLWHLASTDDIALVWKQAIAAV